MKRIAPLLCMLCLFLAPHLSAQNNPKTNVNKDIDVAKVYEQVVKEGYGTPEIYLKLANEYYFQGNYIAARKWFEKVFETEKPTDKKMVFRYKQTLKALKVRLEGNPHLAILDN
ncbi:hypothetical protein [Aureisphaera sp.]